MKPTSGQLLSAIALALFALATGCQSTSTPAAGSPPVRSLDITAAGAVGDGATTDTAAIQKAIDDCASNGGGRVVIPAGTYLTGTLELRSNVELHLDAGAILLGSPLLGDYPVENDPDPTLPAGDANGTIQETRAPMELALIRARGVHDVAITGPGTIDGNGKSPELCRPNSDPHRPRVLDFLQCRNVVVEGVTLRDSPCWVERYLGCLHVDVRGVHVYSHADFNNDGIDIDGDDFLVEHCTFDTDDDGICLKSDRRAPCENVIVRDCVVGSNCNAIKAGTASTGGFKNIRIDHVTVQPASEHRLRAWQDTISAVSLEIVDGGTMDGVTVSNVTFTGVQTPVFIRLGNRGSGYPGEGRPVPIGSISNLTLRDISGKCEGLIPSSITGLPDHPVQNVHLENLDIHCPGDGRNNIADLPVPEAEKAYPENRMFGPSLPASAIYVRHVDGLDLGDVAFGIGIPDVRPTVVIDDGKNIRLNNVTMSTPFGPQPAVRLVNAQRAFITDSTLKGPATCFVYVAGYMSDDIHVSDNHIGKIPPFMADRGVRSTAVTVGP
jgi:hypothetical protein